MVSTSLEFTLILLLQPFRSAEIVGVSYRAWQNLLFKLILYDSACVGRSFFFFFKYISLKKISLLNKQVLISSFFFFFFLARVHLHL